MKTQSKLFVLFLFIFSFLSTRSWAQNYRVQPKHELEASQDAHWLSEEIQRNQPIVSEAQKVENRSTDALHWTAVAVNQQSQYLPAVSTQPIHTQNMAPSGISIYRQVDKPIKTIEKPANHSKVR